MLVLVQFLVYSRFKIFENNTKTMAQISFYDVVYICTPVQLSRVYGKSLRTYKIQSFNLMNDYFLIQNKVLKSISGTLVKYLINYCGYVSQINISKYD